LANTPPEEPSESYKLRKTIKIIEGLKGGGERRLHWDQVRSLVDLITDLHVFMGNILEPEMKIYRARALDSEERFSKLSELTAREHDNVKSFGRCNRPGQSIFYGALNHETAYSEMGLAVGDRVQVIECSPKRGSKIKAAVIGEIDHVRRYGTHSSITGAGYADEIRKYWGTLNELAKLRLNQADAFLADRFRAEVKSGYQYKITSAFSDIVFAQGIDAFFYPSVGHLGGWNIAIKKEVAEEFLDIHKTTVHEIYDSPGYGVFGNFCDNESNSFEEDGTINYPDKREIVAFNSFDELVYYWSSRPAHHRIVALAVLLPAGKTDDETLVTEHLGDAADGAEPMQFTTGLDFSIPATVDLNFEKFIAVLDKNQPDWTGMIVDVVPDEGHDSAIAHLKKRLDKNQGFGLMILTKDGDVTMMVKAIKTNHD
tara:strand:- start:1004 stop:2284 length:1281 start_codon:yes stop_codon:yes gene_type:complete